MAGPIELPLAVPISHRGRLSSSSGFRGPSEPCDGTVSKQRISLARIVLCETPDLLDGVIAGNPTLDAAYEVAQEHRAEAQSEEGKLMRLRGGKRLS